jgi:hypothetical protein
MALTNREERIAKNEALFREVNERIAELKSPQIDAPSTEAVRFLCECGDAECLAEVMLYLPEYEAVRSDPTHFVVAKGHGSPDVEFVAAETDRFQIVRKEPEEAAIAQQTDPRA